MSHVQNTYENKGCMHNRITIPTSSKDKVTRQLEHTVITSHHLHPNNTQ
jgi:hypothetical protein